MTYSLCSDKFLTMENGRLIATNLSLKLPCSDFCPFGRACADKYADGTCVQRVNDFTAQNVFGTPGEKEIKKGQIAFKTQNPAGKVLISDGSVFISR